MPIIQEAELWQSFKKGDKAAFEWIFTTYKHTLYSYGMTVFSDENLVRDCIQELFIEIWTRRESLADVQSIKFYLIKSLRNLLVNQITRSKKQRTELQFDPFGESQAHSIEQELIAEQARQEQADSLAKYIEKLPRRQKELIYLRFYQQLSYEEIMAVTALSYKSVRNHVCLAIQALRKELCRHAVISLLISLLAEVL